MKTVQTQIAEYSPTEAALHELRTKYASVVFDVRDSKQMNEAKKARAEIRGYRTALESKRVEIKAPALERCRLIDAEAKRITSELIKLEAPIDEQIKAEEKRKEDERRAKEEAERQRVEGIRARIKKIDQFAMQLIGESAATIKTYLEKLRAMEINPSLLEEFLEEAVAVKADAVKKLEKLLEDQEKAEALAAEQAALRAQEQARLEAERAELSKLRAAQEEADRAARAKIEAEQAAMRAKIEAEQAAAKAERDRLDREAREKREKEELAARDARAKLEAQEKLLHEQQAAIDAEREAKRKEEHKEEQERSDAIGLLKLFIIRFGAHKEYGAIVRAINAFAEANPDRFA